MVAGTDLPPKPDITRNGRSGSVQAAGRHGHLAGGRAAARGHGLRGGLLQRVQVQGRLQPISADLCHAYLLEGNLDRAHVGEYPGGKVLKEHSEGYGGIWGEIRDGLADDAVVNYQWIESVLVQDPWYRGRSLVIGDAAHACPPFIAQGAAMCAEDAVVLAEMLTGDDPVESVPPAFMARLFPRVKLVLDNSLQLARWETSPTPDADPGRIMGETLQALKAPA